MRYFTASNARGLFKGYKQGFISPLGFNFQPPSGVGDERARTRGREIGEGAAASENVVHSVKLSFLVSLKLVAMVAKAVDSMPAAKLYSYSALIFFI